MFALVLPGLLLAPDEKWNQSTKNKIMAAFFLVVSIYQALYTRIGEGNGTPLQYSCLENPMGGGAW